MNESLSFLSFFSQASFVVKCILLILLSASVFSWTLIFQRGLFLQHARRAYSAFERQFWSGPDLTKMYSDLQKRPRGRGGIARIFYVGYEEYQRSKEVHNITETGIIQSVQRVMRIESNKVIDKLEAQLPWLATIGSVSPFIGLLGTVWGIMTSFQALGNVQQATIAMIAPGISEALIATAVGLFAAIPAVIAYNRYVHRVNLLVNQLETFQEEFSVVISQQMHGARSARSEALSARGSV